MTWTTKFLPLMNNYISPSDWMKTEPTSKSTYTWRHWTAGYTTSPREVTSLYRRCFTISVFFFAKKNHNIKKTCWKKKEAFKKPNLQSRELSAIAVWNIKSIVDFQIRFECRGIELYLNLSVRHFCWKKSLGKNGFGQRNVWEYCW